MRLFLIALICLVSTFARAAQEVALPPAPWVKQTIIYQVWLPSYGPNEQFKQFESHFEHIAKLGVTMLQLSPIHPHRTSASPYSIDDFFALDPACGNEKNFRDLIAHAHRLGLKAIMDVVLHGTSQGNKLATERPGMFEHSAASKIVINKWNMFALDNEKPETRKFWIENLCYWTREFGVDGFRADVAADVPTTLWEEIRAALKKINSDAFLVAEATKPELMRGAFDTTYGVRHMVAQRLMFGEGAPANALRVSWEQDQKEFPARTVFLRTLDNHGQRRAISEIGNKASIAAMAINFTMDGIPFIYNGQEIGDPNPTGVRFPYPIHWQQERHVVQKVHGFSYHRGGYYDQDLPIFTKLISLRKENAALTDGSLHWLDNSDAERIISFLRKKDAQEIIVIVNVTNHPWTGTINVASPAGEFTDLMKEKPLQLDVQDGKAKITLGAFEYLIARRAAK